jgi:hypothetical protein
MAYIASPIKNYHIAIMLVKPYVHGFLSIIDYKRPSNISFHQKHRDLL